MKMKLNNRHFISSSNCSGRQRSLTQRALVIIVIMNTTGDIKEGLGFLMEDITYPQNTKPEGQAGVVI